MKKLIFSLVLAFGFIYTVNAQDVVINAMNNYAQACVLRVADVNGNGATIPLAASPGPGNAGNGTITSAIFPLTAIFYFGGCTVVINNIAVNSGGSVSNNCSTSPFSTITYQCRLDPVTNIATLFITISA